MISPLNLFYFWLVRKACFYLTLMSAFNSGQSTAFYTISTLVPGFLCALTVPLVKVSLLHSGMLWLTIHFPRSPFPLSPLARRQEVCAADSGMEEEGTSPVDILFLPASLQHASSPAAAAEFILHGLWQNERPCTLETLAPAVWAPDLEGGDPAPAELYCPLQA